jgi:hypothetical protein
MNPFADLHGKTGTPPNEMIEITRRKPLVPLEFAGGVYRPPVGGLDGEPIPVIILDLYTFRPGDEFDGDDWERSHLHLWLMGSIGKTQFQMAYAWARTIFGAWEEADFPTIDEFLDSHLSGSGYRLTPKNGRPFDIEVRIYEFVTQYPEVEEAPSCAT